MTPETAAAIRNEQVEVLYRQARITFVPNLVAVPALVYALSGELAARPLYGWALAMYAVTALRVLLVGWHSRAPRGHAQNRRWARALAGVNALSGAGWGFA